MPYIGNNHFAGDHINNFKVLDDISSYTATFDGSSSNVVSTTNETIRIPEHRFIQGQRVTYNNGGGSNIGGLTSGTAYYVSFDSANTVKLATSLANANDGTLINLSSVGGGTSHTLTAAFDGTNTKFKLTHNNGEGGRFNNATQIQVAINNVLQRPNLNSDNFTEGFAIESGNKIVFKTAPTSNDVFWGSIIANTLPTFDVSDNKVDTFTGDGSTTEFNLSHIPANNQSLMVSINGVLQHPSSASTERSYTLIANVIQFTSAPASGDEIQVRHIGFRGATSSSVTGFYGRSGNVVLTSNDHITTGDITSRNVNIAGVTTCAQTLHFPDVGGSVSGANAPVAKFGNSSDLIIGHDGSDSRIRAAGSGQLILSTANGFRLQNSANNHAIIVGIPNGRVDLFYANSKKLETTSTGVNITGNLAVSGVLTYEDVTNIDSVGIVTARNGIDCNGDLDIAGVTTASDNINIIDSKKIQVGNSADLTIHHDGSTASILKTKTGDQLSLQTDLFWVRNSANNESIIKGNANGAVELYHNNQRKAYTESNGLYVTDTGRAAMARVIAPSGYDARIDLTADTHANEDNYRIEANTDQKFRVYGKPGGSYTSFIELDQVGKVTLTRDVDVARHLDVDGHTNLDNVSIAGVTTTTGMVDITGSYFDEGANLTLRNTSAISNDENIANINIVANDGPSGFHTGAQIKFQSGNSWSNSAAYTDIIFKHTKVNSTSLVEAIKISGTATDVSTHVAIGRSSLSNQGNYYVAIKGYERSSQGATGDAVNIGVFNQSQDSAATAGIDFRLGQASISNTPAVRFVAGKGGNWTNTASTRDGYFAISIAENAQINERFRITSSGRVGIGTIAPLATLDVRGSQIISGDLDVDGHTNLDNVSVVGVATITASGGGTGQLRIEGAVQGTKIHLHRASTSSVAIRYQNNFGSLYAGLSNGFNNDQRFAISNSGTLGNNTIFQASENYNVIVGTAVTFSGTTGNATFAGIVTATSYYGDGSNLSNVISGVDVKFEGASVGTGVTMLNFVGFNTVTAPVSGLSTITSGQNLTIGVRSGSAVEASLTGTSFNVIARSGGNISINI